MSEELLGLYPRSAKVAHERPRNYLSNNIEPINDKPAFFHLVDDSNVNLGKLVQKGLLDGVTSDVISFVQYTGGWKVVRPGALRLPV
jgi:hypothetical protein